jgi:hypothetical protein
MGWLRIVEELKTKMVASLNLLIWMQICIPFPVDYFKTNQYTQCIIQLRLLYETLFKTIPKEFARIHGSGPSYRFQLMICVPVVR